MAASRLTRRTILGKVAAALPLPLMGADAGPSRVIDVATHFFDTRRPQGVPWPSPDQPILYKPSLPRRYLEAIRPYRVSGVVAIEASPWLEDNLWLLEVADRQPLIKAVVGNIQPGHPDFRSALDRFAKHPLFRGIRINGGGLAGMLTDQRRSDDLGLLAERGLSLDVLVSDASQFGAVAALAGKLPSLPIIVGHLPLDDSSGMSDLRDHVAVSAKVSGVVRKVDGKVPVDRSFYKARLDELWNVFGTHRVLFASNWPTCDLIATFPTVYSVVANYVAQRTQAEREAFFWGNASRVYRLKGVTGRNRN